MPPCPSGSHIKSGLEALQWIVPTALCAPIALMDGWSPWMDVLCSTIAPTLVRIDDLCTSPPPVYPEIDPVKLAEQGQLYVWSKNLSDWIWAAWVNANWAVLCECLPVTGPGPCPAVPPFGGGNITAQVFDPHQLMGEAPIGHDWATMNTRLVCSATNTVGVYAYLDLLDAAHVSIASDSGVIGPGLSLNIPFNAGNTNATIRANARYLRYRANNNSTSTITQHATMEVTAYTGPCTQTVTTTPPPPSPTPNPPPPAGPAPPPLPVAGCTTDQLCQMIYEVLRQLQSTGQLVTLLQRYSLPFAYILGPGHAGLLGAGSFTISRLVGVRVDITSPLPARQLEGTPAYLWDLGWMSILTADGMIEERRITRDTQVWQPPLIQEAVTFGYFLKPSVVATVTELRPEAY